MQKLQRHLNQKVYACLKHSHAHVLMHVHTHTHPVSTVYTLCFFPCGESEVSILSSATLRWSLLMHVFHGSVSTFPLKLTTCERSSHVAYVYNQRMIFTSQFHLNYFQKVHLYMNNSMLLKYVLFFPALGTAGDWFMSFISAAFHQWLLEWKSIKVSLWNVVSVFTGKCSALQGFHTAFPRIACQLKGNSADLSQNGFTSHRGDMWKQLYHV